MKGRLPAHAALVAVTALAGLLLRPAQAHADVPMRVEQLIYSVAAFDGSGYASTFGLQTADTLYLLADVDNLVSVRKTLVYWWPITAEWKTDTDALNVPLRGTLEVRGAGGIRRLFLQRATWTRSATGPGAAWKVLTGADADRELARATAAADAYFAAVQRYQQDSQAYEQKVQELGARVLALKNHGKDASADAARLSALKGPEPPAVPPSYQDAPQPVQDWFVVNLPAGRYAVRLVEPGGNVIEGSDKRLVVYRWRRTGGIGYEVIPGDRWTRPEESRTPASVLYVNGATGLYLKPFAEVETNDLFYQKTVSNQAGGNPSMYRWVRAGDVPASHPQASDVRAGEVPTAVLEAAVLEAVAPGRAPATSAEQRFTVKQSEGTGLGYTISPYDPASSAGAPPNLVAIPLPLEARDERLAFHLVDAEGRPIPESAREVRVIRPESGFGWWLLAACAPLLAMTAVLAARARKLRQR